MRIRFRKAIIVNCAILYIPINCPLKANIQTKCVYWLSDIICTAMGYERKAANLSDADSISARFAPTLAINFPPHFAITTERTSPI